MLEQVFYLPMGPCREPSWHPDGRVLWVEGQAQGLVIDVDRGTSTPMPGSGAWSPDGSLALLEATQGREVVAWPGGGLVRNLGAGSWSWMGSDCVVGMAGRSIIAAQAGGGERELALAGEAVEWLAVHGLDAHAWVAMGREPAGLALFARQGANRPVERLRLPDLEGLGFGEWRWASHGQGWLLVPAARDAVRAWTFPQGTEWFRADSPAQVACACHMDDGLAWADEGGIHHWDAASHERAFWDGPRATGLAWNRVRQTLAGTFSDGVRVFQVQA